MSFVIISTVHVGLNLAPRLAILWARRSREPTSKKWTSWKEKLQRARKRRGKGTANRGMAGETRIGMDGETDPEATADPLEETDVRGPRPGIDAATCPRFWTPPSPAGLDTRP